MIDTGNGVPFMAFASDENSHYISLTWLLKIPLKEYRYIFFG